MHTNTDVMPRILVVEDEALLAIEVKCVLEERDFTVLGPAASVAEGLQLIGNGHVDAAVLDLNLHNERSDAVADRLERLGVPFLFLTGHRTEMVPMRHRERPVLQKPVQPSRLLDGLRDLIR
ncbi:MAG: response regulator [Pseudomonadota bacterium]